MDDPETSAGGDGDGDGDGDDQADQLDVEALVTQLQHNAVQAELVARQRPDGAALSESLATTAEWLYDFVQLTRSLAHLELGEDPDDAWSWSAKSSSVAESDTSWVADLIHGFSTKASPQTLLFAETNPDRNTSTWGLDFIAQCLHTVLDHMAAISLLVKTDGVLRAPITLARTVLEAAATACFISDTSVDKEERLRRTLNLRFSQIKEIANEQASQGHDSDSEAEIAELMEFASFAGYTVANSHRRGHQPPVIYGSGQRRADSARLVVDQVLPGGLGLSMYRSLSAVAHSRDSVVLLPDKYTLPHAVKNWKRVESIAWHTLPALLVARELCVRLESFLGWDLAEAADLIETVASQWSVSAGLEDAAIRANLGID